MKEDITTTTTTLDTETIENHQTLTPTPPPVPSSAASSASWEDSGSSTASVGDHESHEGESTDGLGPLASGSHTSSDCCNSSGDEAEGEEERAYVAGCFEGYVALMVASCLSTYIHLNSPTHPPNQNHTRPEKTLEVCFKPGVGHPRGCRELTRQQLDVLCKQARCTILNQISNQYQDAYVLSESSLFVWPFKMMLKTCGTTTLLRCLPRLLEYTSLLGLELEWVGYSRKNYSFPGDQFFPHSSFDQELAYLKSHSKLSAKLNGSGYVLGPLTGDHFYVYVADQCQRPSYECHDRVLNIMMFDMDPDAASVFFGGGDAKEMTAKAGIADLVPGATIDAFAFDPCGYSMNAITYGNYATIHVTPEAECSYASFETNTPLKSYDSLINNVLRVFRPKRFVLTMMADDAAVVEMESNKQRLPFERSKTLVPGLGLYIRCSSSSTTFEKDYRCFMGTWVREEGPAGAAPVAHPPTASATEDRRSRRMRARGVSFG